MKNLENWKEGFDSAFGYQIEEARKEYPKYLQTHESDIKSFIESLLTAQTTEMIEKLEGMKKGKYDWSKDEHGKKCLDGCTYCCTAEGTRNGYDSALSDVISLLQSQTNQPQ